MYKIGIEFVKNKTMVECENVWESGLECKALAFDQNLHMDCEIEFMEFGVNIDPLKCNDDFFFIILWIDL